MTRKGFDPNQPRNDQGEWSRIAGNLKKQVRGSSGIMPSMSDLEKSADNERAAKLTRMKVGDRVSFGQHSVVRTGSGGGPTGWQAKIGGITKFYPPTKKNDLVAALKRGVHPGEATTPQPDQNRTADQVTREMAAKRRRKPGPFNRPGKSGAGGTAQPPSDFAIQQMKDLHTQYLEMLSNAPKGSDRERQIKARLDELTSQINQAIGRPKNQASSPNMMPEQQSDMQELTKVQKQVYRMGREMGLSHIQAFDRAQRKARRPGIVNRQPKSRATP